MDFLPLRIKSLTNLVTSRSWYFGSARILRLATTRRRGICCSDFLEKETAEWGESGSARPLGAVLAAPLLAALHADRVERAADDVVADAREVLHAASANHHHRVLLKVVAHSGDVGGHLDAIGEADPRHLAQRGVRLLGSRGVDARAHAALLRRLLQSRALALHLQLLASFSDELANR